MVLLIVLSILTVFCLLLILWGIINYEFEFVGGVGVVLGIVGFFGWVLLGNVLCQKSVLYDIEIPYVHKSMSTVYVEWNGYKAQFTDAETYNRINDSTRFVLKKCYNMYGRNYESIIEIKPLVELGK